MRLSEVDEELWRCWVQCRHLPSALWLLRQQQVSTSSPALRHDSRLVWLTVQALQPRCWWPPWWRRRREWGDNNGGCGCGTRTWCSITYMRT